LPEPTTDPRDITLIVLAGGRGTRMGIPKASLNLEGKPVLEWLLDRLSWAGPTMLVTAPSIAHPPRWDRFGRECVDAVEGEGPLRGIYTGLTEMQTQTGLFVTVDMPGVKKVMLEWLSKRFAERPGYDGAMCKVPATGGERIEPFPSAFRKSAANLIAQRLGTGKRSVRELCDEQRICAIEVPANLPAELWTNLNTREDLAAFEASLAAGRLEKPT
jgi:molybdenum cofactor guanylyltransferase